VTKAETERLLTAALARAARSNDICFDWLDYVEHQVEAGMSIELIEELLK